MFNQHEINIALWDTAGPGVNGFQSVSNKWIPEIRKYCPNVPIVLSCSAIDLRTNVDLINGMEKRNEEYKK